MNFCVWLCLDLIFSFLVMYRNDWSLSGLYTQSVKRMNGLSKESTNEHVCAWYFYMRMGVQMLQPLWKQITLVRKCGILNCYQWWAFYPEIDHLWYERLRLWSEYHIYCLHHVFWQVLGYWTIYYSLSGTVLWCRHQSQSEGWWSCRPNLCNQTSHFKGISLILPEV